VDDAGIVRGFERLRDLSRDRQRFIDRNGTTRDALGEIVALDELHHQRRAFNAIDVRDVRVIQGRQHFGFTAESRQPLIIICDIVGQHFDGDVALQIRVARAIHLAHAARTEQRHHLVRAYSLARGKGHVGTGRLWITTSAL
jgi:hypothetical protein